MGGGKKGETIRAFVALELDPMSIRRMGRIAEHLRMASGAPCASWTPGSKLHATLFFVAALPVSQVDALGRAVDGVVQGQRAPRPITMALDAFPSAAEAEVVVVMLDDPDHELAALAGQVRKIGTGLGLPREPRVFRPHVTIARLKRSYDARRWLRADVAEGVGQSTPHRVALYRSVLSAEGS
jgi:2'-5' RNA ligase